VQVLNIHRRSIKRWNTIDYFRLSRQLKMIDKLKDIEKSGALSSLNEEQKAEISKKNDLERRIKSLDEATLIPKRFKT